MQNTIPESFYSYQNVAQLNKYNYSRDTFDGIRARIIDEKDGLVLIENKITKKRVTMTLRAFVDAVYGKQTIAVSNISFIKNVYMQDDGINKYRRLRYKNDLLAQQLESCQHEAYEHFKLKAAPNKEQDYQKVVDYIKKLIVNKGLKGKITKEALEIVTNENAHMAVQACQQLMTKVTSLQ